MKRTLIFALALGLLPGTTWAGPLSDVILAPGAFQAPAPGEKTHYDMTGGTNLVVQPVDQGAVLSLALERTEGARHIAMFPATGANPVLLYFLETLTQSISRATGGSPHYIRNRLREALGSAGLGSATDMQAGLAVTQTELRPFAEDPNRDRMGVFADLTLRFGIAADGSGRLVSLSADTAAGGGTFAQTFTLSPKED